MLNLLNTVPFRQCSLNATNYKTYFEQKHFFFKVKSAVHLIFDVALTNFKTLKFIILANGVTLSSVFISLPCTPVEFLRRLRVKQTTYVPQRHVQLQYILSLPAHFVADNPHHYFINVSCVKNSLPVLYCRSMAMQHEKHTMNIDTKRPDGPDGRTKNIVHEGNWTLSARGLLVT